MLIYFIIAAELAIMYTVFWYVYVHEPKPYKLKGGLWGSYGEGGSADPTAPGLCDEYACDLAWQPGGESARAWEPGDELYVNPDAVRRIEIRRVSGCQHHIQQGCGERTRLIKRMLNIIDKAVGRLSTRLP